MILGVLLACGPPAVPAEPAELVVRADRIVEVRDGRIVRVLPVGAEPSVGPATQVLDADHVTAGFVDAHAHPDGLGKALAELDLVGASSYADTLARVEAIEGDGWLLGRGWDQNDWADAPPGGWPLASDLERLHPGRPVVLRRVDGHASWVSPEALRVAKIDRHTADPAGGRILRDAAGEPTGVLVDNATDLVKPPPLSADALRRRLQAALVLIAAKGLTGVHAMGASDDTIALLEALDREGRLPVRLWIYADPDTAAARRLATSGPWGGDRLEVVGVKAYADGALGSRGALLTAPYADDPASSGIEVTPAAELERIAVATLGGGGQVAVHAIGDLGVRRALDVFAAARAAHPERAGVPLRVEHAQVVHPDDVPRFRALGVVASMQPTHATSDSPWAEARLGPERVRWSYAWRTLLDAGAALAFGSDFPVERVDPGLGIAAGTTRGGWRVEEALTLHETIAAFTSGAAAAVGRSDRFGTLEVGREADLTLWWEGTDGAWRAAYTIVGGEIVAAAR